MITDQTCSIHFVNGDDLVVKMKRLSLRTRVISAVVAECEHRWMELHLPHLQYLN